MVNEINRAMANQYQLLMNKGDVSFNVDIVVFETAGRRGRGRQGACREESWGQGSEFKVQGSKFRISM